MKLLLLALRQVCFFLLLALILLLAVGVFLRYVLGSPLAWSTEASSLLLAWLSFLGIAVTAAERRHMVMDLLRNKWRGTARKVVEAALSVIIILSSLYVIYYGIVIVEFNLGLASEELQIPYGYFYSCIPAGFFFYLLFEVRHLFDILRGATEVPDSDDHIFDL